MRTRTALITPSILAIVMLPALVLTLPPGAGADGTPPEAFEVGPAQTGELPRGKEADGIIGDFVLRNGRIEALVGGNLPDRKANMGTNWSAPTPGCLYDLAVRGSQNDQLTCFSPGNLEGRVSSVRLVSDGSSGAAVVRVERTAVTGGGLEETHDYRLDADATALVVTSTWTNHGDKPIKLAPAPVVKGLRAVERVRGISFGDAQNPADRQGYAWTALASEGHEGADSLAERELAPGASRRTVVAVAPGRSPAEALGHLASRAGPTGTLAARLVDTSGAAVTTAAVRITFTERRKKPPPKQDGEAAGDAPPPPEFHDVKVRLPAYPDGLGRLAVALPPGTYPVTIEDVGRATLEREVTISAGETTSLEVELDRASSVRFVVTEDTPGGRSLPCKAQFVGIDGTPDPLLGVELQAHGCDHQYFSERGEFTVNVPPGKYQVIVTRGIEYSHHEERVVVGPAEQAVVRGVLRRVVDTRGWISTDYHNHSTPSGDNYCGTDDRLINLAAEDVEFAPATEHNRIYDWGPHVKRLGLEAFLGTIVGMELTGPNAHFNAFPLVPVPYTQDNGAPQWVQDPRINALVLRDFGAAGPDRWVHINHPNVGRYFRDRDADGVPDGGYENLELLVDAAEVWSTEILNMNPSYVYTLRSGEKRTIENRTFSWLQLLNQGRRMWCLAVSDAHSVFNNGVGGWRTYVPSSTDDPAAVDWKEIIRNSKAGRMVMTNGPFLEATLHDGTISGGMTIANGTVRLKVRVQTNTWIQIDRVQVLVNGRPSPKLDFRRSKHPDEFTGATEFVRFDAEIPVPLTEDAHLIVVAMGEAYDLKTGYGRSWQSSMHPCAFTNPIYVDIDGDGFRPNGDTLGFPLPVGKLR